MYQSHVQMLTSHQKFIEVGTGRRASPVAANDDETLPRTSKTAPKRKK